MNNFISLFVATLSHLELITEKEAKKLAEEFHSVTIPDNYTAAHSMVEKTFAKVGITKKNDLPTKKL